MTVESKIEIDCDALASELIEQWANGNKNDVIRQLSTDHAGLTAMVIVTGSTERTLSLGDVNEITNRLMDERVAIARNAM